MAETLPIELEQRALATREALQSAVQKYGKVVYSNSLGIEAMVLTDIIWSHVPEIDIISLDTGRLHEETYELMEKLERRYKKRIKLVYPDSESLAKLVEKQGVNAFFHSLDARLACCHVRKVEPFKRAIQGYGAWVTGVRRQQSKTRSQGVPVEWDEPNGLYKISPLLDWTEEQVWQYVKARKVPYNVLHDRSFPSIGCSPCTRAIQPGEDQRAGRWWWENADTRECGLQPRVRHAPAQTHGPVSVIASESHAVGQS